MTCLLELQNRLTHTPLVHQAAFDTAGFLNRIANQLIRAAYKESGLIGQENWPDPYRAIAAPCWSLLEDWLDQIAKGMPLAYIIKEHFFYKHLFYVNPSVLIPRPETEQLVDTVIKVVLSVEKRPLKGCELGIGSGVIALSLLLESAVLEMDASDCSKEAIAVAHKNAVTLLGQRQKQLHLLHVSQEQTLEPFLPYKRYDFFVSNPPYLVDADECDPLVAQYEPSLALFAKPDAVFYYRQIAALLPCLLKKKGWFFLEIPHARVVPIMSFFEKQFHCTVQEDLNGYPRVLMGQVKDGAGEGT